MGLRVYWELCQKYNVNCADASYNKVPDEVRESEGGNMELWWDRSIKTIQKMEQLRSGR